MGTGSQWRRNMAKRFAAGGALLGVDNLRAEPVASGFTMRIHALDGGARHEGHNALSPWQPAHAWVVSFPERPSPFLSGTMTCAKLSRYVHEESMGNKV
jgi:hypothetical protein